MRAHCRVLAPGHRAHAELLLYPVDAVIKNGARNDEMVELTAAHQSISFPLSRKGYEGPKSPMYSV